MTSLPVLGLPAMYFLTIHYAYFHCPTLIARLPVLCISIHLVLLERHQDPEKHSSASNLRILMDSPAKKKVINLLEDYEPVGTGHVRWADRMPHTIEPSSFG